jgi:hypothetical protein
MDHYRELLESGRFDETGAAVKEGILRYQIMSHGTTNTRHLSPAFIDEETYEHVHEAAALVFAGLATAAERLLADGALRRELGIPSEWDPPLEIDRAKGKYPVFARLDGMLTTVGRVMFLEYNGRNIGGLDSSPLLNQVINDLPIAREFKGRFRVRHIDPHERAHRTLHGLARARGRDAICIARLRRDANITGDFPHRWLGYIASRGAVVLHAPPEEFELRGGDLYVGDQHVDLVLFEVQDLLRNPTAVWPIIEAVRTGSARSFWGVSRLMMLAPKSLFHVLSAPEYAQMFQPEVLAALARHIPWTRIVREGTTTFGTRRVDLLPFIADNRDALVLKPSLLYGGTGVVVGRSVSGEVWQAALRRAADEPFVVQEFVETPRLQVPLLADDGTTTFQDCISDVDPFLWDGQPDGCMIRASPSSITNMIGGGSAAAVWILEGRG